MSRRQELTRSIGVLQQNPWRFISTLLITYFEDLGDEAGLYKDSCNLGVRSTLNLQAGLARGSKFFHLAHSFLA